MTPPAPLPSWWMPLTRRAFGLGTRPVDAPKPAPQWCIEEWVNARVWLAWVAAGKPAPRPDGLWKNTAGKPVSPGWVVALKNELKAAGKPPFGPTPPPPPPPAPLPHGREQARHVVFCAGDAQKVLAAPHLAKVSLSADPGVRRGQDYAGLVQNLRDRHCPGISAWCDCRESGGDPSGTPARVAIAMAAPRTDDNPDGLGLDYVIGQCESPAEFDHAYDAGLRVMVGNWTALRTREEHLLTGLRDQQALVASGEVTLLQEQYWNVDPAAGYISTLYNTVGVYDATAERVGGRRLSLRAYIEAGRFPSGSGLYHAGDVTVDDWAAWSEVLGV